MGAPEPRTLKLVVAYDGTRFKGWQRGNGRTVQGVLEDCLLAGLGKASRGAVRPGETGIDFLAVVGAGRTDAGVHAEGQVASVRVPRSVDPSLLLAAVNALLPEDLAVRSCEEADARFHARYRASAKTYRYRIVDGIVGDPFLALFAWRLPSALDDAAMREAAPVLVGSHDFTSFTADKSKKDKIRNIYSIDILRANGALEIYFRGDGFLWNQVRIMASFLVAAGKGEVDGAAAVRLLEARDRSLAPPPAPAKGLCLVSVEY
jgi:tRNA pseudouridine38-40 synthase